MKKGLQKELQSKMRKVQGYETQAYEVGEEVYEVHYREDKLLIIPESRTGRIEIRGEDHVRETKSVIEKAPQLLSILTRLKSPYVEYLSDIQLSLKAECGETSLYVHYERETFTYGKDYLEIGRKRFKVNEDIGETELEELNKGIADYIKKKDKKGYSPLVEEETERIAKGYRVDTIDVIVDTDKEEVTFKYLYLIGREDRMRVETVDGYHHITRLDKEGNEIGKEKVERI